MTIGGVECMTVGELKAYLDEFPPETPIVYREFSDYSAMTIDVIAFYSVSDQTMVYRNNGVREVYPQKSWGDEVPVYVTVLTFPGN